MRRRKSVRGARQGHVYCLVSRSHRDKVYTGATCNPIKRLKQHNGLIIGGGKYTSRYRPWSRFILISGLKDKGDALRFESTMKKTIIGGGVCGRIRALFAVLSDGKYGSDGRLTRKRLLRIKIYLPMRRVVKILNWTCRDMQALIKEHRGTLTFSNHKSGRGKK